MALPAIIPIAMAAGAGISMLTTWLAGETQAQAVRKASKDMAEAERESAKTIADASDRTLDLNREIYEQSRRDAQPWHQAGVNALNNLQTHIDNGMQPFTAEDMYNDPGYAFRLDEANKQIHKSLAARGKYGPAAMREMGRYFQGLASQEYGAAHDRNRQNYLDRLGALQNLSGAGQTATNQLTQSGQNYGDAATRGTMVGANALASGRMGAASALASGRMGEANTRSSMYLGMGNNLNQAISSGLGYYQGSQLVDALGGNNRKPFKSPVFDYEY